MTAAERRSPAASVLGPYVIVTMPAAAIWAPVMRGKMREAASNGARIDPIVRDVVEAFEQAVTFVNERNSAKPADDGALSNDSLLTVAAVAARAGVTEQWVRSAARAERLPGRRAGRAWVFEQEDVDEWIRNRESA